MNQITALENLGKYSKVPKNIEGDANIYLLILQLLLIEPTKYSYLYWRML